MEFSIFTVIINKTNLMYSIKHNWVNIIETSYRKQLRLDDIKYFCTWGWRWLITSLSSRNQSMNLLCKSMNWFLYDRDILHDRVKLVIAEVLSICAKKTKLQLRNLLLFKLKFGMQLHLGKNEITAIYLLPTYE